MISPYTPYYGSPSITQPVNFPYLQPPTPMTTVIPSQTYQQNIPSVDGVDEAKALNIGKNATALILDKSQNVLYVKSTDGIGAVSAFSAFEMKQIDLDGTSKVQTEDRMSKMESDIAEIKKLLNEKRGNDYGKRYTPNDGKQKQSQPR